MSELPIFNVLQKYKTAYFISYKFIFLYSVLLEKDTYIIDVRFRSIASAHYQYKSLLIHNKSNIEQQISTEFMNIYEQCQQNKTFLPLTPKPKKRVTFNLETIQEHPARSAPNSPAFSHVTHPILRNPYREPPTFKIYRL